MSDIVKDDTQTPPSLKHQIEDVLRDTQTLNGLRIEGLNYKVTAFTRAPLLLEQALAEIKVLEQRHADALDALNRMTDQRDEALGGQPAIELPQHRLRVAIQEAAEYNEMIPLHTDDPDALSHQQMVRHWLSGKGMHPQQVDRIGQLVTQIADATRQCGVLADLVNRMVIMMGMAGDEPENNSLNPLKAWMFEAQEALSGKLPYLHITKPARIGGVVFQPGIKASSVLEAAYRAAEDYEPNPAAFKALQGAMLAAAPEPEGGAA